MPHSLIKSEISKLKNQLLSFYACVRKKLYSRAKQALKFYRYVVLCANLQSYNGCRHNVNIDRAMFGPYLPTSHYLANVFVLDTSNTKREFAFWIWTKRRPHDKLKTNTHIIHRTSHPSPQWPCLLTLFNFNPSNYMPSKVWDEVAYIFLNLKGCTVEVLNG